jgi:fluoroquinolone resistance protein
MSYLIESEFFSKKQFTIEDISRKEFDSCVFKDCDFSNSDLSMATFLECRFDNCNLSNIKAKNTAFKDVAFINCKMLGFNFSDSNPFLLQIKFENCQVNLGSFFRLNLSKTSFKNTSLREVDFSESNLSHSKFNSCDLAGAIFDRSNLEHVDFYTSENYTIDPQNNKIRKARFNKSGVLGLLSKYDIKIED